MGFFPKSSMRAGGGFDESEDEFEEGGFSAAVRADDADELARVELEVHGIEHGGGPVAEGYVFEPEDGVGHGRKLGTCKWLGLW